MNRKHGTGIPVDVSPEVQRVIDDDIARHKFYWKMLTAGCYETVLRELELDDEATP